MGTSDWSDTAYTTLSRGYATKSKDDIFADEETEDMSPKDLNIRESRDSDAHPESLAIVIGLDETGSMGHIPEDIIKNELGTLMNTIIEHGVEHPQIMFCGIGDHKSDRSPLQVGQFESGTEELDLWLKSIYLEGNGGGQNMESYLLAWLVAGRHTSIDCFEKRNQKGFLFTIGDERNWGSLDANTLKELLGYPQADEVTDKQLLEEAQRMYNVYHIHVNETSYKDDPTVLGYWKEMLGERLIILDDYHAICATIATVIAVQHGVDMSTVIKSFDADTADTVSSALATLNSDLVANAPDEGVLNL